MSLLSLPPKQKKMASPSNDSNRVYAAVRQFKTIGILMWQLFGHLRYVAVAILLATSSFGCCLDSSGPLATRKPPYGFGFYNGTKEQFDDVLIHWKESGYFCSSGAGVLSPDGNGGPQTFYELDPIPARVTLTWRTPDGKPHARVLEVASKVKDIKHFTGRIWFKFTDNTDAGVQVIPMTEAESDRLAGERKPIVP